MAFRSFWGFAAMLAALALIFGIGAGVQTFIAHGQGTSEPAVPDDKSGPQQSAPPLQTNKPVEGGGPLQTGGSHQAGPLQGSSPLQGAGPIQAALPPMGYDVGPPSAPPNFAGVGLPDYVASGCFSNDRLASIMGAPKPPTPEVLDMLVKDLKNPCADTPPPPPQLVVASATPVSTNPTTNPPTLPPTLNPTVVLPPVVFNTPCQAQVSQSNC
jgi:hypothetical protein